MRYAPSVCPPACIVATLLLSLVWDVAVAGRFKLLSITVSQAVVVSSPNDLVIFNNAVFTSSAAVIVIDVASMMTNTPGNALSVMICGCTVKSGALLQIRGATAAPSSSMRSLKLVIQNLVVNSGGAVAFTGIMPPSSIIVMSQPTFQVGGPGAQAFSGISTLATQYGVGLLMSSFQLQTQSSFVISTPTFTSTGSPSVAWFIDGSLTISSQSIVSVTSDGTFSTQRVILCPGSVTVTGSSVLELSKMDMEYCTANCFQFGGIVVSSSSFFTIHDNYVIATTNVIAVYGAVSISGSSAWFFTGNGFSSTSQEFIASSVSVDSGSVMSWANNRLVTGWSAYVSGPLYLQCNSLGATALSSAASYSGLSGSSVTVYSCEVCNRLSLACFTALTSSYDSTVNCVCTCKSGGTGSYCAPAAAPSLAANCLPTDSMSLAISAEESLSITSSNLPTTSHSQSLSYSWSMSQTTSTSRDMSLSKGTASRSFSEVASLTRSASPSYSSQASLSKSTSRTSSESATCSRTVTPTGSRNVTASKSVTATPSTTHSATLSPSMSMIEVSASLTHSIEVSLSQSSSQTPTSRRSASTSVSLSSCVWFDPPLRSHNPSSLTVTDNTTLSVGYREFLESGALFEVLQLGQWYFTALKYSGVSSGVSVKLGPKGLTLNVSINPPSDVYHPQVARSVSVTVTFQCASAQRFAFFKLDVNPAWAAVPYETIEVSGRTLVLVNMLNIGGSFAAATALGLGVLMECRPWEEITAYNVLLDPFTFGSTGSSASLQAAVLGNMFILMGGLLALSCIVVFSISYRNAQMPLSHDDILLLTVAVAPDLRRSAVTPPVPTGWIRFQLELDRVRELLRWPMCVLHPVWSTLLLPTTAAGVALLTQARSDVEDYVLGAIGVLAGIWYLAYAIAVARKACVVCFGDWKALSLSIPQWFWTLSMGVELRHALQVYMDPPVRKRKPTTKSAPRLHDSLPPLPDASSNVPQPTQEMVTSSESVFLEGVVMPWYAPFRILHLFVSGVIIGTPPTSANDCDVQFLLLGVCALIHMWVVVQFRPHATGWGLFWTLLEILLAMVAIVAEAVATRSWAHQATAVDVMSVSLLLMNVVALVGTAYTAKIVIQGSLAGNRLRVVWRRTAVVSSTSDMTRRPNLRDLMTPPAPPCSVGDSEEELEYREELSDEESEAGTEVINIQQLMEAEIARSLRIRPTDVMEDLGTAVDEPVAIPVNTIDEDDLL